MQTTENNSTPHTPGPWRIWRDMDPKMPVEICDQSANDFICQIHGHNTNATENAQLIATAPDLLAALQDTVTTLENYRLGDCDSYRDALAAIAKATGKEN